MVYCIQATVTRTDRKGRISTVQVPTFYLHEKVQGIVSEQHAHRIAQDILLRACSNDSLPELHISVGFVPRIENEE